MKWSFWNTAYWLFWIFGFVVWELYAASKGMGNKDVPMLTQAVVKFLPWWIVMPFLTWLWIHFAIRFANPAYLDWLKHGTPLN